MTEQGGAEKGNDPVEPGAPAEAAANPLAGLDMNELFAQASQMQQQMAAAQRSLEAQEVAGSAGGGLVTALVSGTGELLSLTIARSAVDPDDTETLADLIVAAVRDGSENAKELQSQSLGPFAGGFGDMPDLGGMSGMPGLPGRG